MIHVYQVYIEALIFTSNQSIRLEEIIFSLQAYFQKDIDEAEVLACLLAIEAKFNREDSALQLVHLNDGYQLLTKKQFHEIIIQLQQHKSNKKLSQSAIETLAIIAYQQPVSKLEIEQIRRVNCDYSIHKLLEKELISIAGKSEALGRPILYKTSPLFMDYFGINNMTDLPQLKDVEKNENTIGELNE